jgi:hypothetical protein
VTAAFDWMFRDRNTGRVAIAQFPNAALWMFLVASVARRVMPGGTGRDVVRAVAVVALTWWALDEVARGVNPWRRILGLGVFAATVISLLR